MDLGLFERGGEFEFRVPPIGAMRVPAVIYADEQLILDMDDKVFEQVTNVAMLPGIVKASYAMPDAHWGYGFPIGGVAAFDPDQGGVVSAGGVGFDISCGVRAMLTGLKAEAVEHRKYEIAQTLFMAIPAGLGRTSVRRCSKRRRSIGIDGSPSGRAWEEAASGWRPHQAPCRSTWPSWPWRIGSCRTR